MNEETNERSNEKINKICVLVQIINGVSTCKRHEFDRYTNGIVSQKLAAFIILINSVKY